MSIEITGIGNMKDLIFEELSLRGVPITARKYQGSNDFKGVTLLVYDGLQIKESLEYLKNKKLNVISIFIELDRVLFVGNLNMEKNEVAICAECGISRIKEYFASAKMHQTIIKEQYCFEKTFFLQEEVKILCDQIMSYIEDQSLHGSIGTFSFDFYTTIYREISGYTNCVICDHRESKLEELILAIKGAREDVITIH